MTLLLAMAMTANFTKAQDIATQKVQGTTTYVNFPVNAGDTVVASATWYGIVSSYRNSAATQDVLIKLKDVSGDADATVTLYGRKFTTAPWVSIGTVCHYNGGGTDSTAVYANATANRYRDYKIAVVATSATQKILIEKLEFKEYNEGQ